MADLIDRQAAIDLIRNTVAESYLSATIEQRINHLPSVQTKWHNIKDKKPDPHEDILLFSSWTGRSGTAYEVFSLCTLAESERQGEVPIAWMPLPHPQYLRRMVNDGTIY